MQAKARPNKKGLYEADINFSTDAVLFRQISSISFTQIINISEIVLVRGVDYSSGDMWIPRQKFSF